MPAHAMKLVVYRGEEIVWKYSYRTERERQ